MTYRRHRSISNSVIIDQELLKLVVPFFSDQRYEQAVFAAFKCVEERLRRKSKLPADNVGAALIAAALHHDHGILKVLTCQTKAEEEGVFFLFRGAIQLLKNPSSHRTVDWKNPQRAAQALLLADFLFGLVDVSDWR